MDGPPKSPFVTDGVKVTVRPHPRSTIHWMLWIGVLICVFASTSLLLSSLPVGTAVATPVDQQVHTSMHNDTNASTDTLTTASIPAEPPSVAGSTAIATANATATATATATANATATATATATANATATATATATPTNPGGTNIVHEQELSLVPGQKGIYLASGQFEIPDSVRHLAVDLPEEADVQSADGFHLTDERTWEWDGTTNEPTLEYHVEANRTVDERGPIAGPGRHMFVDVGDWALVSRPAVGYQWSWERGTRVGLDRKLTATDGAAGEVVAFLGGYEEYTHDAHGQTFRLIVPEVATLEEDPTALFESLANASDRLRVGARDESVFMVAAPTRSVEWGVRGLATGQADMWVRDFERLADPDNVWLHEYVHTRQDYAAESNLKWVTEATATYYGALLSLEQGHITYEQFRNRLKVGSSSRFANSILNDPATWEGPADYQVGALVSGALDRAIRVSSEGAHAFDDVFRELNRRDHPVSATDFIELVESRADQSVKSRAETYTGTTERPDTWSQVSHANAFADRPVMITADRAPVESAYSVSGDFRERPLDGTRPIELVVGETLTVEVIATNHGGKTGTTSVDLLVDGTVAASREVTLDPDESTTLSLPHTFGERGEYVLAIGDDSWPVSVHEPANATVTGFQSTETAAFAGDRITLTATVDNTVSYPGKATVSLVHDGNVVETALVHLDAELSESVSFDRQLDTPGTHIFWVENATVDPVVVTVEESTETEVGTDLDETADEAEGNDDPPTRADDDGSGFGIALVLGAIAGFYLLTARRSTG